MDQSVSEWAAAIEAESAECDRLAREAVTRMGPKALGAALEDAGMRDQLHAIQHAAMEVYRYGDDPTPILEACQVAEEALIDHYAVHLLEARLGVRRKQYDRS